ncbi:hypothetical protein L198_00061 [Cryptococcus wingfieldii CBS 7118]|uniref:GH16 domain-containing protein n=1 Tax=Cryptococcus wingfieldii CBS 7118 TaxID=1295528 RepID=A0A1E3K724_9TREE|nr:hypothetical protein L198_00061 [Cryptococcus wingfieldii CBS 7118]ODO08337.1 hypothetical protein L198_00061 [Cryptococcus wingfieldii CBS 7118]
MRQALFLSAILPILARGVLANTCKARGASSTAAANAADATSVDGDASSSAADIGDGLFASGDASTSGNAAASVTSAVASVVTSTGQTAASGGASGDAGDTDIAAAATSATLALSLAASDAANATSTASTAATSGSASASSSGTSTADDPMGTQVGTDLVLGEASEDCKCGYKVSSLNDQYFPYQFSFAFSSVDDGSADSLADQKWVLNDGDFVGGAANGNRCWGKKDNLYIDGGNLVLKVPKDQTASPNMECAEIAFEETNITGGIFQTTAMLSGVDGTCQAFWLNHSIATQYADEVDIEVISSTIDTDGIWYSNWPPNGDPNTPDDLSSAHTNVVVPDIDSSDPRKTYNNYTIAWLDDSTNRYYNGAKQDSPTDNQPEHSMMFVINNWSNGGSGWTLGPPTGEDSLLKVKSVLLYYKTADKTQMSDLGGDCQESDVCTV